MGRRITVGWVEVESAQARMWRQCSTGDATIERRPRVVLRSNDGGYGTPRARYWCAADRPPTDDGFALARVYKTTSLGDDACCEACGIALRDLQKLMTV